MPLLESLITVASAHKEKCEHLGCGICLSPLAEYPVTCAVNQSCSSVFCLSCFEKWGESCPLCRTRGGHRIEKGLRRVINNMTLPCPKCNQNVSVQDWEEHEKKTCPEALVDCTLGCNERLKVGELQEHISNNCRMRMEACKKCEQMMYTINPHTKYKHCIGNLKKKLAQATNKITTPKNTYNALMLVCRGNNNRTVFYRYKKNEPLISIRNALRRDQMAMCAINDYVIGISKKNRTRSMPVTKMIYDIIMPTRTIESYPRNMEKYRLIDTGTTNTVKVACNYKDTVLCVNQCEDNSLVFSHFKPGSYEHIRLNGVYNTSVTNDTHHMEPTAVFPITNTQFCVFMHTRESGRKVGSFVVVDVSTNTIKPLENAHRFFSENNLNLGYTPLQESGEAGRRHSHMYFTSGPGDDNTPLIVALYEFNDSMIVKRRDCSTDFVFNAVLPENHFLFEPSIEVCFANDNVYIVEKTRHSVVDMRTLEANQDTLTSTLIELPCHIPTKNINGELPKSVIRSANYIKLDIPHIHHISPCPF